MANHNFQVNLQGIIELLSNHLYSDPAVFVRELLQNCVDAITARKRLGHTIEGVVKVDIYSSGNLSFHDNGCGLTETQIEQFLARIGSSTKRGDLDSSDDFIGKFGVGLLSCFVVSDEIVLITRSALEGDSLEWRGRPDGTYQMRKLDTEVSVGTTVYLKAKQEFEDYFEYYRMYNLLEKYGKFLPTPIYLIEDGYEERINNSLPPWQTDKGSAFEYIRKETSNAAMDIIPLRSALGGVQGIAYILPYSVSLQDEKRHHVYLKNMLLSDKLPNILPPWAFFVNAVLNTDSLRPTASRESFQENDLFYNVREELGHCIKQHLVSLATEDHELFKRIVLVHYASIKAMAVEDAALYELFIRHLSFETSLGKMDAGSILAASSSIYVTSTLDEFRQVARVAQSQDIMVVNGGYTHDLELIVQLPTVESDVQVGVLDVLDFSNRFMTLSPAERKETEPFLHLSDEILNRFQCRSLIRLFEPADIPVLYNTSNEVNFFKLADNAEKEASPFFAELVHTIRSELYDEPFAKLCFNYNNPIVRKAASTNNREVQKCCIELLYTQALLMGNHTMNSEELRLLNESLLYFMNKGLNESIGAAES
ncbi:HSP90 family protein [Paenibacillus sp. GCM10027627]|uniref:HSP90 family protein n=1 Tax=unclassified Paenibacillus TaxID=185978 RepID=UPI00364105AB